VLKGSERRDCRLVRVRNTFQRQASTAAFGACIRAFRHQLGACHRRNPPDKTLRALMHGGTAQKQQDVVLFSQHPCGLLDEMRVVWRRGWQRQGSADHAVIVPRCVTRQNECRNPARRSSGGGHRRRGVDADAVGGRRDPEPARDRSRPALDIRGQRSIERPMICSLIADNVDDAGPGPASIVEVCQSICEAGAAVEQCRRRLAGDTVVGVGCTGRHVLLETQHAAHAWYSIKRSNKVHLARAGICETAVHPALQQRMNQAFSTIHSILAGVGGVCWRGVGLLRRDIPFGQRGL
jgi:hypothetical protein